jgi:sterol desaturase/sphingolipid hydroxylase (fatty acid hydroxylase superfamily)
MAEAIAHVTHLQLFLTTVISFAFLYVLFTTTAYYFLVRQNKIPKYQNKPYRPGQIRKEIRQSIVSILMFGVLSLWVCEGLHRGFFKIHTEFSWSVLGFEILLLFFWNEIHFYIAHRIFHLKPFYKYHAPHHYSHIPSPFAAYSFHWSEGLVLGAVMPTAMMFHDFQFMSLMVLPLMSIVMNVLAHTNLDFFPDKPLWSLWNFAKRHSSHHKIVHANFGFFLPFLDQLFGTHQYDD